MTYSPNFRGTSALGASRQLQTGFQNGTLSTVLKGTPVALNGTVFNLVDVTSEISVKSLLGVAAVDIPSSMVGGVADSGRLENVTTSFSVGDVLYVDKTGALTNIKPDIGVNSFVHGDWVVLIGVVVLNQYDALKKDIKLVHSLVGQL